MAKFRVRSKTAKKGSRWAKGQSSSSNPEKTKYRDSASKTRALRTATVLDVPSSIPSRLTEESLLKHDALLGHVAAHDGDDDAKTTKTFASDWTMCSNVSFGKLMHKFDPRNARHKEMLAVLAAVTELVKSDGSGEESSTEYLAALLTALESADTIESLDAILQLVAMAIKTVPAEVLQSRFGLMSKLLLDLLQKHSENVAVCRALIGCLSVLLRAQSMFTWKQGSTLQVFQAVLAFTAHPRPKIRKQAQHAVCAVLKASLALDGATSQLHPAAKVTAEFCCEHLTMTTDAADTNVLHTMTLLKDILGVLGKSSVKDTCEQILSLMRSKAHPHITTCAFQVFYGLFSSRPSVSSLPAEMNAQLVSAFYDYKPSVNDPQAMVAWLTVQQEALGNLATQNADLCLQHLVKFFSETQKCWLSDRKEVCVAATTALKAVTNECIAPHIESFSASKEQLKRLEKVFSHVFDGLGYQYHQSWDKVLHLLSVIFDVCGSHCPDIMGKFLRPLAELRSAPNFALSNELDYVVGKAIRRMGPKAVLAHIDLQITGKETNYDFPRSWLLPVLRENIQNTELAYFMEYFLPLTERCRARSQACLQMGDKIGSKMFEVLECQMWALLPGFCSGITDIKTSFKQIAKVLGDHLKTRKEIRLDILSSLRHLIAKAISCDESRAVLATYAKNYLPILCNLYTTQPVGSEEASHRLAAMETIKQFLRIAPSDLLLGMFDNALNVYERETGFTKDSTMDILASLLAYQDVPRIDRLYQIAIANVKSSDHREQKKAYKVLEVVCACSSDSTATFLNSNVEGILKVFLLALSKSAPSSQASRIRSLTHIARRLDAKHSDFVFKIIPEVILSIKAANKKAREGAYALLVVIGESLQRWNESSGDEALLKYMESVLAGLAGSSNMVHCTLLALAKIYFEFRDLLSADLIGMLLHNVCMLLTSQTREVTGAALSFLKVFVVTSPLLTSAKHVKEMVGALVNMTNDCKRHFRLKTKYLMDRLVRKFGFDVIAEMIPRNDVEMHKRLKNIRKIQARKEKQRAEKGAADGSDEEDGDEDFRLRSKPKTMEEILAESDSESEDDGDRPKAVASRKGKMAKSFITEDADNIVDFLDPSAAQQVTAVRPKTAAEKAHLMDKKKKAKMGGFSIASDGRIIIKDSDDDSDDEEDDDDDDMKGVASDSEDDTEKGKSQETFQSLVASRKRKMNGGSVASSRRTAATSSKSEMRYEAGGSGIHRALSGEATGGGDKRRKTEFGSEYRAKKARGDVKLKGRPDPYAYVPLQKSTLNKRKRAKFEGQFKNIVKAAKQGSSKGIKAKGGITKKMKRLNV